MRRARWLMPASSEVNQREKDDEDSAIKERRAR